MSRVTLSVVVPAYNEERYIRKCLSTLAHNREWIDEVVVVDNNSTDRTRDIAMLFRDRFEKFAVISEQTPGVVHARNAGFNATSGDIIARVDADTIVGNSWARAIHEFFREQPGYAAVTGLSYLYESPVAGLQRTIFDRFSRRWRSKGSRPVVVLSGANMAIRRSAWETVENSTAVSRDVHEDVDLSLCLLKHGFQLGQAADMLLSVSGRRGNSSLKDYLSYTRATKRTFVRHGHDYLGLRLLLIANMLVHAIFLPLYKSHSSISRIRGLGGGARALPVGDRDSTM
ncbi:MULTISPECIES: glycosyltransferase family 2 protein [Rhodococcus]|uniref:Glycosyltransferase family 2 protein n=1 Tax=Rhodococcus sp. D-6 TaxID=1387842 RepID=A0AAU7UT48_9NOCA|nr:MULTISPECIES: glycosyltransferase family 2 protein [Rhodococcus]MCT7294305.1 glycosyltransferase [Rhodococcus sp. PAE-6]QXF83186.1 glycosyltransferase [Rhodococcus pyridinivorans]QXU52621.1 glycosyltransferase [Rhodococcus sp. LW-XY12]UTM36125.1 glycosyltransferase [Rhodococcus pyridinivorans]